MGNYLYMTRMSSSSLLHRMDAVDKSDCQPKRLRSTKLLDSRSPMTGLRSKPLCNDRAATDTIAR